MTRITGILGRVKEEKLVSCFFERWSFFCGEFA